MIKSLTFDKEKIRLFSAAADGLIIQWQEQPLGSLTHTEDETENEIRIITKVFFDKKSGRLFVSGAAEESNSHVFQMPQGEACLVIYQE